MLTHTMADPGETVISPGEYPDAVIETVVTEESPPAGACDVDCPGSPWAGRCALLDCWLDRPWVDAVDPLLHARQLAASRKKKRPITAHSNRWRFDVVNIPPI